MDFRDRIKVWDETRRMCATPVFAPVAPSFKVSFADEAGGGGGDAGPPYVTARVENVDSIEAGRAMLRGGTVRRPLVLVMADHRFAGGDVASGSGAQEESIFRRTTLSATLTQKDFYPIRATEAVISPSVTVLRDTEGNGCRLLPEGDTFRLDFVACPGLHNPVTTTTGSDPHPSLSPEDEQTLRIKVRVILQAARRHGNDGLVLGAMGCGAWRNPPRHVAAIMKDELRRISASSLACVTIACLEVDPKSYIVRDRTRTTSNFEVFRDVFAVQDPPPPLR